MRLALLIVSAVTLASPALAQGAPADSACTFETCALALDQGPLKLRRQYLRAGQAVPNEGRFGLILPPLAPLVSGSPEALAHVEASERACRTSSWFSTASQALLLLVALDPLGVMPRDAEVAGLVAGSGALALSLSFNARSERERRRAIRAYNEGLPGRPPPP